MHTKQIEFAKMHGLGNDFVIIDAVTQDVSFQDLSITHLADRYRGIGFDQLLMIEASTTEQADFFCRIFNPDGSEAEQCGNGLRCVARFIQEHGLLTQSSFQIATIAGTFAVQIFDYDHIRITMGAPKVLEKLVNFSINPAANKVPVSILSLGNPHTIINTAAIDSAMISQLGPVISTQPFFPNGTNVGFMEVLNPHHIRLRTYERAAGETHACGSNACAAVVAGMINQWLKERVEVEFRYGSLLIEWQGGNGPVFMTGPAAQVFEGVIEIKGHHSNNETA